MARAIRNIAIALLSAVLLLACSSGDNNADTTPLDTTPPETIATPPGGLFGSSQQVILTSDESATIYYSTDGNDPSVDGANTISGDSPITGIAITNAVTILKFFAIDNAGNQEIVNTEIYTVDTIAPVITFPVTPPIIGLLQQLNLTWQSDEAGTYIIELGGTGVVDTGTQLSTGSILANTAVSQSVRGAQLSFTGTTDLWVYVTDSIGNAGSASIALSLKPTVSINTSGAGSYDLRINTAGTRAYLVAGNAIKVLDIDVSSQDYNTEIASVLVGSGPRGLAITPDDSRVYVVNQGSNSISVINASSNTVIATIATSSGSNPYGIAITPDGTRAYFSSWLSSSDIVVLDVDPVSTSYHTIIRNILISPLFLSSNIAITADGNKAIINWQGSIAAATDVLDVNPASPFYNFVIANPVPIISGSIGEIIISADSNFAYVRNTYCGLCKIDLADYSIPASTTSVNNWFALTPNGQILLTGKSGSTLEVIDADDLGALDVTSVPGQIQQIDITPDGSRAYAQRYNPDTTTYDILMIPLL